MSAINFREYWGDETFSDLTLRVKSETYRVHRIVLCAASSYFAEMFKEANNGINAQEIGIQENDLASFDILLRFIYGTPLTEMLSDEKPNEEVLPTLLGLLKSADKYGVSRISQPLAVAIMRRINYSNRSSECTLSTIEGVYNLPRSSNPAKAVKRAIEFVLQDWIHRSSDRQELAPLLETLPELAARLLDTQLSSKSDKLLISCPHCGNTPLQRDYYVATKFACGACRLSVDNKVFSYTAQIRT